jgi:hypothetical protein
MMNQQEMNDYIEKWTPDLASDFADARTGGHVYMDRSNGPLPSEIVRARRFLQRCTRELAYHDWEKEVLLSDTDETRQGFIDRYGRCKCVTDRCINEYDDGVSCLVCENMNPFWPCFHSSTTPWPRPDQIIAEK